MEKKQRRVTLSLEDGGYKKKRGLTYWVEEEEKGKEGIIDCYC